MIQNLTHVHIMSYYIKFLLFSYNSGDKSYNRRLINIEEVRKEFYLQSQINLASIGIDIEIEFEDRLSQAVLSEDIRSLIAYIESFCIIEACKGEQAFYFPQ